MKHNLMDLVVNYGWIGFAVFLVSFFLFKKSTEWAALLSLAVAISILVMANVLDNPRSAVDYWIIGRGVAEIGIMLFGFTVGSVIAFCVTKIRV